MSKTKELDTLVNNVSEEILEKLYNHNYKYRFFINQDNYDYTNKLK